VLAAGPAVVLLDEPAGGVNPTLIQHIADRIRELNAQGTTFLIVEHNMEFVMGLCHQITVLDYGTVVAAGPPGIIARNPRVLDAYLGAVLDDDDTGRPGMTTVTTDSALAIEGLYAGYGGGDILHDVSFSVPAGGVTCVVGPNGAGKSTLLAAISGLLRPRRGRVLLHGQPVTGRTPRQILAMGLVHVPQQHSLFRDMTVAENLDLGAYTISDRRQLARSRARVHEMFPEVAGWAPKKAGSLSGGQQRLVEFARGLMLDPSLIILDEPSMGLAPKVLRSVFGAVTMMNEAGKTVLLVEQNARAGLRLASHGVVLENGRVRLTGSGREVLDHPEIGALYLGGTTRDLGGTPTKP
jgi:ABC-type branched-subunit amino acid transport system ATPase component